MSQMDCAHLTLDELESFVRGGSAGIRVRSRLIPAGGPGDKVFPPTYQGGQYAREKRWIDGAEVETVVLDSVQSQANRMELALLAAHERGEIRLPLLFVDFGKVGLPYIGRITSLDAPHRIADAVFRESFLDGVPFRDSELGKRFAAARYTNATPLWELCPTALIFGVWDSTGAMGGMGTKFARALVSEIVGFQATTGVRTASRVDPLPVSKDVKIYKATPGEGAPGGWTLDESKAERDERGRPKLYGQKGKASELNFGNVTPDIAKDDQGRPLPGGVTISHALHVAVLSFPALRRLKFPLERPGAEAEEVSVAARITLAALALCAITYLREEGYDLRSRCLLVPDEPLVLEVLPGDGTPVTERFSFSAESARGLFNQAVVKARQAGLPWPENGREEIELQPHQELVDLIRRSEAQVKGGEG